MKDPERFTGLITQPFSGSNDEEWYIYPAFVALSLSLIDLVFFMAKFKETLPEHKRLQSLEAALLQALTYINPVSLFNFESLSNGGIFVRVGNLGQMTRKALVILGLLIAL